MSVENFDNTIVLRDAASADGLRAVALTLLAFGLLFLTLQPLVSVALLGLGTFLFFWPIRACSFDLTDRVVRIAQRRPFLAIEILEIIPFARVRSIGIEEAHIFIPFIVLMDGTSRYLPQSHSSLFAVDKIVDEIARRANLARQDQPASQAARPVERALAQQGDRSSIKIGGSNVTRDENGAFVIQPMLKGERPIVLYVIIGLLAVFSASLVLIGFFIPIATRQVPPLLAWILLAGLGIITWKSFRYKHVMRTIFDPTQKVVLIERAQIWKWQSFQERIPFTSIAHVGIAETSTDEGMSYRPYVALTGGGKIDIGVSGNYYAWDAALNEIAAETGLARVDTPS